MAYHIIKAVTGVKAEPKNQRINTVPFYFVVIIVV